MRTRWIAVLLSVVVAGLTTGLAWAQPKGGRTADKSAAGGAGVVYKQRTVYDFEDDLVEGDLVRPDGEFVDTRRAAKHSSLIKIRENFIPEMLKSAEDL
jgi:hypothetical protein